MPRQSKLPALKRLEGNPGKRLIVESGIEALGAPFIPEHLMEDARGCIECIQLSMPAQVYSALDSFLLAAFGMAWAVHKKASHMIAAPDFVWVVTNSRGSLVQNPWLKVMNQQAAILASLGDRLGLDPKSRTALRLPGAKQHQAQSRFGRLLNVTPNRKATN